MVSIRRAFDGAASGNGTSQRAPRAVARMGSRTSTSDCAVCRGPLFLRYAGSDAPPSAASFAPSRHQPGEHGDLYECRRCGTVQQPSLPGATRAALAVPRHGRRRLPRRGGWPAADRRAPARPDRAARARKAACSTSAAATACCSPRRTSAATTCLGSNSRPARSGMCATTSNCPSSTCRSRSSSRRRARVRRHRPRGRARARRRPGRGDRRLLRDAQRRRCAVRRHARPLVRGSAARGPPLVGLPARSSLPAATSHGARAARLPRARDLHGRAARAVLQRRPLGGGPRRARRCAKAPTPTAGRAQAAANGRALALAGRRIRRARSQIAPAGSPSTRASTTAAAAAARSTSCSRRTTPRPP